MSQLASMQIEMPGKDSRPATDEQRRAFLEELPEWEVTEQDGIERLQRAFKLKNFVTALEFANYVGALAEEINHHPAILVEWGQVTVQWWTHVVGGLHPNDFIAARRTNELYNPETA